MKILEQALSELVPSREEERELKKHVGGFLKRLNRRLGDAKAILGGSLAKGTWLSGQYDADIFVQFPLRKYRRKALADILQKRIKFLGKLSRLHGSRDYFQYRENRITYEIVPILKITKADQAENITDISPLHAKWVNKHCKDKDQVRLAKAFMKAHAVYGAESYIQGFSGYVVEILSVHYGSFRRLVGAAAKWRPKTVIDTERHHRNVMLEVNTSKLVSPLIVIDPVQAGRNAAAGLNMENYLTFVVASQAFLTEPTVEYFRKKKITKEALKPDKGRIVYLSVLSKPGKEDVVGSKLLKAFNFLSLKLTTHGFEMLNRGWEYNKRRKAVFWYVVRQERLKADMHWMGPPLKSKEHVATFKKKHKRTFTKNKRIWARVKRKYNTPEALIRGEAREPYIKDKVSSLELE
jgi:tRNA nucleotidyltransferase (CCA-adding enzyme)